ncbi:hypothetical protein BKA70DRAFT_776970 [Coprinopsis sp. MPI-PUGE-AT-0042]|nr:hypothetical protein BKA70DRAFT_776970 [Coprinopsis sp. MPI-PUGE-AT-0042]
MAFNSKYAPKKSQGDLFLGRDFLDLRSQRNHHTPISLLPNEIICRIFQYCRVSCWSPPPTHRRMLITGRNSKSPMMWINVTHVCRHWRNIALSYADLWSHVNDAIPFKWLNVMLERVHQAPLTVLFRPQYFSNERTHDLILKVLSETSRLKRAKVMLQTTADVRTYLNPLTSPAPSLTDLSLSVESLYGKEEQGRRIATLPINFLAGYAPALRKLELARCFLPWQSTLFQRLTSLRIVLPFTLAPADQFSTEISPTQFIDILSNSPGLAHLDLEMEFPDMETLSSDVKTQLDSLEFLKLAGTCTEVAGVLRLLGLTISTKIQLRCSRCDEASLVKLGVALQRAQPLDRFEARYLRIEDDQGEGFGTNVKAFTNADDMDSMDYIFSISVVKSISENSYYPSPPLPSGQHLLRVLPWEGIETVRVACPFGKPWDKALWREILEAMKPTRHLVLTYRAAAEFVRALLDSITADPSSALLPNLQSLTFYDINIVIADHHLARYGRETREMTIALESVRDMIEARRQVSTVARLETLSFVQCRGYLDEATVKELEKAAFVDQILWDGEKGDVTIFDWGDEDTGDEGEVGEGYNTPHIDGDDAEDEEGYWFGQPEEGEEEEEDEREEGG